MGQQVEFATKLNYMPQSRFGRIFAFLLPLLALYTLQDVKPPELSQSERILLLTAHPDDECFFFGPTLLALSSQTESLFSLTISNGNNDGIGSSREPELRSSLAILGIPSERSFLLNHPHLQDNFTQTWDAGTIVEAILPYILDNRITTVLTFDRLGVSSHPNHYSLYYGSKRLLASMPPNAGPLRVYSLVTVPLLIKYTGWLSLISKLYQTSLFSQDRVITGLPALRFTAGLRSYLTITKAINQHRSQMVWFRYLYFLFSSYLWQNDWVEIDRHVEAGL